MALRLFPVLGLIALLLMPGSSRAQHLEIEHLSSSDAGARIAFTFAWPGTLQSALDSASASVLDARALAAVTGTLYEASDFVTMPIVGIPSVSIVESQSDQVTLEPASDTDSLLALLTSPIADAGWPGVSGRQAVATVRVRTVSFDATSNVLRRYRRIVVDVVYPTTAARKTTDSVLNVVDNPHLSVMRSVLADGYLFKIPVRTEGIYRLDASYLKNALGEVGLSLSDVDPGSIKLYGNGGAPLPALNAAPRPADLIENPVQVSGSGDGLSVVFYARGPQGWTFDPVQGQWIHYTHPFSNDNYYFLKVQVGTSDGRRVSTIGDPGSATATLQQVLGRHVREYDDVMWSKDAGTGHTWVSSLVQPGGQLEVFANATLPGLSAGTVQYRARVAQRTFISSTSQQSNPPRVRFLSNGALVGSVAAGAVSAVDTAPIARAAEVAFSQQLASASPLNLSMTLDNHQRPPAAALDWIRVFYPQDLRATDGYLRFVTPAQESGVIEFVLTGFNSAPTVWDVTRLDDIRALNVNSSGGSHRIRVAVAYRMRPHRLTTRICMGSLPTPTS